ncbi:hypothetical protein N7495_008048 [Penicillium taxi]|uniref:uncharacterized protein n=1 Tax=Penicillium taxi TaxID=168475 RepID=UPI0025454F62|nr:uncharacterized protein N7495_008048 [Penicillium taxi]KAJ5888007.1 hypothetical protein N7495_008048 [Penicillium taxi]
MAEKHGRLPHLRPAEVTLLNLASDDSRDVVTFSDKEQMILRLMNGIQEQRLEKAFLEQKLESLSGENAQEQFEASEREYLEARATYTVRKKAATTILMTDPILKAVHLNATTPPERALFRLINRRDVLALAHENLATTHDEVLKKLSDTELENLQINHENQELVRELQDLVRQDSSWEEKLKDEKLTSQLSSLAIELKANRAKWETMKHVASAMVVGSGLNWADNDTLRDLVLDESLDESD